MKKFHFRVNGNFYEVELLKVEDTVSGITNFQPSVPVVENQASAETITEPVKVAEVLKPVTKSSSASAKGAIKSPLPGIVRSIDVKVGDKVKKHDKVMVIEAMKMDNGITSEVEGIVVSINVSEGEQVLEGDILIEVGG